MDPVLKIVTEIQTHKHNKRYEKTARPSTDNQIYREQHKPTYAGNRKEKGLTWFCDRTETGVRSGTETGKSTQVNIWNDVNRGEGEKKNKTSSKRRREQDTSTRKTLLKMWRQVNARDGQKEKD